MVEAWDERPAALYAYNPAAIMRTNRVLAGLWGGLELAWETCAEPRMYMNTIAWTAMYLGTDDFHELRQLLTHREGLTVQIEQIWGRLQ